MNPKMRRTVMLVDDDADFRMTAKAVLSSAGYRVVECASGSEALAAIRKEKPDLVVLDVMMETGSAGFQVAQELRRDRELGKTPVLMVTAIHGTTPLRFSPDTDGEFLPVDRFLDKPVAASRLLSEVERLLG